MKRKIAGSKIYRQDAGLILETFQGIVDEIPLPEGHNWRVIRLIGKMTEKRQVNFFCHD